MSSRTPVLKKEKNIKNIILSYLKYWYLFVLGVVICVSLAFLYLRYKVVEQYSITSTLLVNDKDKGAESSGAANSAAALGDLGIIKPSRNIEDEIGIIKSNSVMVGVINELDLQVQYYVVGRFKDIEVYGKKLAVNVLVNQSEPFTYGGLLGINVKNNSAYELVEKDADGKSTLTQHKFGEEVQRPFGKFTVVINGADPSSERYNTIQFKVNRIPDYADALIQNLNVITQNKTGSLLDVSYVDNIQDRGEDILNSLATIYGQKSLQYKNELATSTINLIDDRLSLLTEEITDVEKNVESYKQRNDLTSINTDASLYLQKSSEINRQLAQYQNQIDVLNSIDRSLRQQGNDLQTIPSSVGVEDPTLMALIGRFNQQSLERNRMLRTTPASNPLVVEMEQQLKDLRTNILENLVSIRSGLDITRGNLEANSNRVAYQINKVPAAERQLTEISRDQSTKQSIYLFLLQKREEEALSRVASITNSRVIDEARASKFPISPNKTSIYLGAMIAGLFIPFLIVFVRESSNNELKSLSEVQQATRVPILGEIAHNSMKDKNGSALIATEKNTSPVAELFRLIRSNLRFATMDAPNKVILITSGKAGEGKTFFSVNLGATLALAGNRVVVVDFDLRAPRLMQNVNLPNTIGVTDYLIGQESRIADITIPHETIANLSFIGSGQVPPNAGELILSKRVAILIEGLKEDFDYILLDSSPVGKVADAYGLAPYTDSTLFILRYNYSEREQLEVIDDIYEKSKLKNPFIVLNDSKTISLKTYGYGGK